MNPFGATLAGEALTLAGDALRAGKLCPVIGAGASVDAGAPTWVGLVRSLADAMGAFETLEQDEAAKLIEQTDPTILVELIAENAQPNDLSRRVGSILDGCVNRSWVRDRSFSNRALRHLAELAIRVAETSPGRDYHVITFNFDTLLEEAIQALGHPTESLTPHGSIRRERVSGPALGRKVPPVRVRVAHPHGLAPRPGDLRVGENVAPDLILAAAEYYARLATPLAKPSVWQIDAFASLNCLFYGFSFNDFAVRYLLGTVVKARHQPGIAHVALVCEEDKPWFWQLRTAVNAYRYRILRIGQHSFDQQKRFIRVLNHAAVGDAHGSDTALG
ncbi:hypothetical protein ABI59_16310 [Acidobacteria bacterium Mor1]|nr:hypothetical protein ABI59_16310 [Acidobacteria bacterium Mor1]